MGAVSALGVGCAALQTALERGEHGIRPVGRFDVSRLSVRIGALVPDSDDTEDCLALSARFAAAAVREAIAQAHIDASPERVGLVLGTALGDDDGGLHAVTEAIADAANARGPRITVATACSSSTNAVGAACDLLRAGDVDVALAGGADALGIKTFAGFHALGVLSELPCAPFSDRMGTTLGEGAGFLVLEHAERAAKRGARVFATVLGHGLSADAFHATSPDPRGRGIERAVRAALADAAVAADAVDYVNAHGTGTALNDIAEWQGLRRALGARADDIPVSSSKSFLGHAQGAAGILEIITTIVCMLRDSVPPTIHLERARPRGPRDPVAQQTPRPAEVNVSVCTNSAFGGSNAAVVIGRSQSAAPLAPRRSVFIAGVGTVVPPDGVGRVPAFDIDQEVPTADPRGVDPATTFLATAAARALADANVQLRGAARERAGLIVGTTHLSATSAMAFDDSMRERGIDHVSAVAFSRMVMNAPAGACSRLLGLKGPLSTITTGRSGGLVAIALAADRIAHHADADLLIAGGFEELHDQHDPTRSVEGAACVALGAESEAIEVAGWAIGGAGEIDGTVARALGAAGCDAAERAWLVGDRTPGDAVAPALALVEAVGCIRRGDVRSALIASSAGESASCAVVLRSRGGA
jgi:3-oxoacyl-[acyl-carrier-protein] synthase II